MIALFVCFVLAVTGAVSWVGALAAWLAWEVVTGLLTVVAMFGADGA